MHPATEPLRARSPALLRSALAATLNASEDEWLKDWRDLLVTLAPFHDCARRLALDPAEVFQEAADAGPPSLRDTVAEFGRRTDVSLTAFAWVCDDTPEGPSYRSTLWPHDESPEDYFRRHGWLVE